ncbi:MAG: hypothetical protein ACFCU7_01360 [Pleurocapsa sp.]
MTKSIQQVKQDLSNLKSTVADIAIELEELQRNYLELLSQSLKQQLILASYQICTQLYPQSFLNLSLSEKQDLQQNLRQICLELEPNLAKIIEQKELEPESIDLNLMAELIKNLPKPKRRAEDSEDSASEIDLELVKAELENLENLENVEFIQINTAADDVNLKTSSEQSSQEQIDFENPEHLILWYKQIERSIKKTLDVTSRKVNKCLQESKILPDRIPNKVIDVAMQADSAKGVRNNYRQPDIPHVLYLAIETDQDKKSKSAKNLQISLLRLRLAEVEFYDHLLNAKRGQIRNLIGKIKKLNSKYKVIQQEAAVIEAQAAWRSSWYED